MMIILDDTGRQKIVDRIMDTSIIAKIRCPGAKFYHENYLRALEKDMFHNI